MTPPPNKPQFSTAASTGQTLSSDSFRGKVPVVMLFIPDVDAQAAALSNYNDAHSDFAERRMQLLAVTPLTASDARDLADSAGITYPILADPSLEIFREFGAANDDNEAMSCSVVVDKAGTVADMTESIVSPEAMMAQLDDLEGSNRFEMAVNR